MTCTIRLMWDWLNQNKQWVFSGIGVAALGPIWWMWKRFLRREPATSPGNTVTQTPNLTQSPTININVPQPHTSQPPEQPRPAAIPRSRPNLICVGPERIRVHYFNNDKGEEYFYQTVDENGLDALVAWFRNEPGTSARGIQHVRVNIIYRDQDGKEIGAGLPRASWLGDNADTMDFHVGDSHAIIMVLRTPEGDLSNISKRWSRGDDGWGNVIKTDIYPLHEGLKTIELRVLSDDGALLAEPVRFSFSLVNVQVDPQSKVYMTATRIYVIFQR
jgi:hypothetical protein